MNVDTTTRTKTTGVYGADLVPGTYVKTRTGVTRGEELFSRPDLERPWRSTEVQKRAATIALKEKEIEELMRLCSNLRTELGNAKSDARFLEFSLTERMKNQSSEKDVTIAELQSRADNLTKDLAGAKEDTEHQIRLLKSQHENELLSTKSEARLATERCTELAKAYQKQVEDIKTASARELQFVESRFTSRVAELTAELKAVRESTKTAEQYYLEQATASKSMLNRIEDDYKERLRASEQRVEELRKSHEAELEKERKAKEEASADARRSKEQLVAAMIDRDEVSQRYKLWNNYVLSGLDKFYDNFVAAVPELAVEPADPQLHEMPSLYAPRIVLEEPEAKLAVERIAYRLLQLKKLSNYAKLQESIGAGVSYAGKDGGVDSAATLEAAMFRAMERQERLKAALRETSERVADASTSLDTALSRLYFFSDNLESGLANMSRSVKAPLQNVLFVCLSIASGDALWASDAETMRTAVTLMESSARVKMGQYGAYECYSDDTAMLLAFGDPAAACRFCTECQEWLIRTPWPAALLRNPLCKEESSGDTVLFGGLRVAMAIHCGECFIEPTGMPTPNGMFRSHYYGRAVSQILYVCAMAQGGQILVTRPAWNMCLKHRHNLGQLTVTELGTFPIMSFNSQTGLQERQALELYQVSPQSLRQRCFKPTVKLELPPVSSLAGAKRFVLATEIAVIEGRQSALKEALDLVQEEYKMVHDELSDLLSRGRACRSQFHLLPPPEMVTQMNDLYAVMERVAVRAEEVRTDHTRLANMQEELEVQLRCVRDYLRQQNAREAREDGLRTEIDVSGQRMDATVQEMTAQHRREVDKLQSALRERDQMIRQLCTRIEGSA